MQTINLPIAPGGVRPVIHVSQFDVGRQFSLKLYDGVSAYTPPTGTTIRIDGIKPDGHGFSYTDVVSASGNTITITTTTQMTIVEGTVKCELRLSKNSVDIGTVNFDMVVERSPINESTDMSETEVPAIIELATEQMENSEAWAVGTKGGIPVPSTEPQYHNSAKYWAESVGGLTQDSEAWARGTRDGVPVDSSDETYHNNSKYYSEQASTSATNASNSAGAASTSASNASTNALKAEGYAVGKQNGTAVSSGSPYYHNNAEYFAGEASSSATAAGNAADRAEAAVVLEPYIGANGNWFVYNFSTQQYVDTNVSATGPTGNGISTIAKTSTSGLVDTYTITYTDGTTSTFTVTNGDEGPAGNGIVSITKTSSSGLVDTYTILFTNGQTTTFTVTNGANGTGSGDMLAADYDANLTVKNAGGIVAYVASQISGLSTSLSGLSDVALGTLATGESLIYDSVSGKWVNGNVSYSSLTGKPTLGTAAAKDFTTSVTLNSGELVTSGGVAAEIQTLTQEVTAILNVYGGKNLLPNDGLASSTNNGIIYTKQSDGTVLASGTATGWAYYNLGVFSLEAGTYIVSGHSAKTDTQVKLLNNDTSADIAIVGNTGNEVTFALNARTNIHAMLYVGTGAGTITDFRFSPMIRDARIVDSTYEPYAMTNQQLTPYAQSQSNPNLLDNPWFTVNQRGQSSYGDSSTTGNIFTVDRWRRNKYDASGHKLTVGGIELPYLKGDFYVYFVHFLEANVPYTISAIIDGTVYSKTFTPTGESNHYLGGAIGIDNLTFNIWENNSANNDLFGINNANATQDHVITAIKLEKGTVSTLAMDTVPNYQQELAKCQRYFVRLNKTSNSWPLVYGFVYALSTDTISYSGYVPLPTTMRAVPTISYPDITCWSVMNYAVDLSFHAFDENSSITIGAMDNLNILPLRIVARGTGIDSVIQLNQALLLVANTSTYLDLSADL